MKVEVEDRIPPVETDDPPAPRPTAGPRSYSRRIDCAEVSEHPERERTPEAPDAPPRERDPRAGYC